MVPLRHIKDWDSRDNDIHSGVPARRTAISQIDEFYTENPVHTWYFFDFIDDSSMYSQQETFWMAILDWAANW